MSVVLFEVGPDFFPHSPVADKVVTKWSWRLQSGRAKLLSNRCFCSEGCPGGLWDTGIWMWSWAGGSWWPCLDSLVSLVPCYLNLLVLWWNTAFVWTLVTIYPAVQSVPCLYTRLVGQLQQKKPLPQEYLVGDHVCLCCAHKMAAASFRKHCCIFFNSIATAELCCSLANVQLVCWIVGWGGRAVFSTQPR